MTETLITDFNQIINIGVNNEPFFFYRGQSKEFNSLTPGVYRKFIVDSSKRNGYSDIEPSILQSFKTHTSKLHQDIKVPINDEEWLFLAQHNGIPTRLLDWSLNILKALFFAVIDNQNENGELWSLNVKELNKLSNINHIVRSDIPIYEYLIHDAFKFEHEKKDFLINFDSKHLKGFPLAIIPLNIHYKRLEHQEGVFTIHSKDFKDIVNTLKGKNFLHRLIIPKNKKREYENNLVKLGISYDSLFPDFYGISKDIERFLTK